MSFDTRMSQLVAKCLPDSTVTDNIRYYLFQRFVYISVYEILIMYFAVCFPVSFFT